MIAQAALFRHADPLEGQRAAKMWKGCAEARFLYKPAL